MSTPDPNRVLVTGVGGPSGHAAVTALRARGYWTLAVDMNDVAHGADAFARMPAARTPEFVPELRALLATHRIGWLFPTVAEELAIVASLAPVLRAEGISVFMSAAGAVRVCEDKWRTAEELGARGVAVPRGALDEPTAAHDIGYPLLSRPRVGRGGRGVTVHDAAGTVPAAGELLWQEFLDGTEYDVLLVRDPRPPQAFPMLQVFEKTKLKQGRVGNAVDVVPIACEDVADLARAAVTALGLTGPIDLDIRRGRDGLPRLLEINARIGAHALKAPAVFDVLAALHRAGCRG